MGKCSAPSSLHEIVSGDCEAMFFCKIRQDVVSAADICSISEVDVLSTNLPTVLRNQVPGGLYTFKSQDDSLCSDSPVHHGYPS